MPIFFPLLLSLEQRGPLNWLVLEGWFAMRGVVRCILKNHQPFCNKQKSRFPSLVTLSLGYVSICYVLLVRREGGGRQSCLRKLTIAKQIRQVLPWPVEEQCHLTCGQEYDQE